jgi:hypothetical protein
MDFHRSLEMSVSREEFFRLLPAAVTAFDADGEMVWWSDGGRRRTIRLLPLAEHRMGSVVVPRHRIEIVLEASSESEGRVFMERFHRAFLRGGG